jgi:hypothetical protein
MIVELLMLAKEMESCPCVVIDDDDNKTIPAYGDRLFNLGLDMLDVPPDNTVDCNDPSRMFCRDSFGSDFMDLPHDRKAIEKFANQVLKDIEEYEKQTIKTAQLDC